MFKQFGEIAFKTVTQVLDAMDDMHVDKHMLHPYWLAYLFERFTSCYFHALEMTGKRFVKIPLACVDANKHVQWTKPEVS